MKKCCNLQEAGSTPNVLILPDAVNEGHSATSRESDIAHEVGAARNTETTGGSGSQPQATTASKTATLRETRFAPDAATARNTATSSGNGLVCVASNASHIANSRRRGPAPNSGAVCQTSVSSKSANANSSYIQRLSTKSCRAAPGSLSATDSSENAQSREHAGVPPDSILEIADMSTSTDKVHQAGDDPMSQR